MTDMFAYKISLLNSVYILYLELTLFTNRQHPFVHFSKHRRIKASGKGNQSEPRYKLYTESIFGPVQNSDQIVT